MKDISRFIVYAGVFAVPFIPLIISNSMFFPFITGKNFAFRIIVEIIFASWIILALYDAKYRPKFSWIPVFFIGLLVVMFFANLFGEYPLKSFWSNFERMDGYVTLVHVFGYFMVIASVLNTEKLWNRFFNTTLAVAVILSLYAFAQLSGNITINQGGWRLDGTLGNSAYMAVYMLFHTFIAALMFVRTKSLYLRYLYAGLGLLFIYLLVQTATRGAILGLMGGASLAVIYIALFANHSSIRKAALGGIAVVVVVVGTFIAFKESSFVQENPYLSRLASISLEEAETRFTIWTMAFEGVKERPILGWGQGNYNYVFNKYYNPELYGEEAWFDRVHNIVMDWLIAGGVLGTVMYFGIITAALVYLLVLPLIRRDERFSTVERGILFGLLAAYFAHNFFVFDNIVSYIFYASILGFIHYRVAAEMPRVQTFSVNRRTVDQIAVPVVVVILAGTIYYVNVPNILAARDIIDAFRAETPQATMAEFEQALSRNSFADQEIREQMMQQTQRIIRADQVPPEVKQSAFKRTEAELLEQAEEKPGDARVHSFIASFYRSTNNIEAAAEQLEIARSLSPNKQLIMFEQGLAEMQRQEFEAARAFFKEAYDLAPEFHQARELYATALLYTGERGAARDLFETERQWKLLAQNDLVIQAAYNTQAYSLLKEMFEVRIEDNPNDPQLRVNLAVVHHESGDTESAIAVLKEAAEDIPSFAQQAEGYIEDLQAGRSPGAREAQDVQVEGVEAENVEVRQGPTQN